MKLGIIGGTNAQLDHGAARLESVATRFGACDVEMGALGSVETAFIRRHGMRHERISSLVDHRAHIAALRELGVDAVVGTSVCGVVDPRIALGMPILFDDQFFPDNRLPSGGPCTFFDEPDDPNRGHLIASAYSPGLRRDVLMAAERSSMTIVDGGVYAYMLGPRFNTRSEIAMLSAVGAVGVSQTAGPEAVLCGEMEIPYCLIGFGVDYATGVSEIPTPVEVLDANIEAAKTVFGTLLTELARGLSAPRFDSGFVYRLER